MEVRVPERQALNWRVPAAVSLWLVSALLALVLAARGVSGAFDRPVTLLAPCVATTTAMLASLGAWALFLQGAKRQPRLPDRRSARLASGVASLAAPAVIGWATTMDSSPFARGVCLGTVVLGLAGVLVIEGIRALSICREVGRRTSGPLGVRSGPKSRQATKELDPDDEIGFEQDVVQELTRRQAADGSERIDAVLCASFAIGEAEAVLHLPIHPVLRAAPHVECEPLDDSPVVAEVTAAHAYGVRIEVRRPLGMEASASIPIGVEISVLGRSADVA